MTQKEIKKFYLSLIDNTDAIWSVDSDNWLTCSCNDITIKPFNNDKIVFSYTGKDRMNSKSTINNSTSNIVSYKDIGISYIHLWFPYFGIVSKVKRRIANDLKMLSSINFNENINSVATVISKDKALNRDNKLKQILK